MTQTADSRPPHSSAANPVAPAPPPGLPVLGLPELRLPETSALRARKLDVPALDLAERGVPTARTTLEAAPSQPATPVPGHRPRWLLWVPELVVSALALAVFTLRIDVPSPWRDEGVTLSVVNRPFPDILDLVSQVDLVHATYYLLMHAVFGAEPLLTPLRLISALAAALTTGLLVRIGRQLESPLAGIVAGLLLAVAPIATRYAQEARPYALTMCASTLAVLCLLRACRRPWRRRRWVAYGLSVGLAAAFNMLSLLVLAAHVGYVLGTAHGRIRRAWLTTLGWSSIVLVPFVGFAATQRSQVSWLTTPSLELLSEVLRTQYDPWALAVILVLLGVLFWHRGTIKPALALGLVWALAPPLLLWSVSQVHPLFAGRYVLVALPGGALAMAAVAPALVGVVRGWTARFTPHAVVGAPRILLGSPALAAMGRVAVLPRPRAEQQPPPWSPGRWAAWWGRKAWRPPGSVGAWRVIALVPVAAMAISALPMQSVYRDRESGHSEDVRGAAALVQRQARPGDAILFAPGEMRIIAETYPEQFNVVWDLAQAISPTGSQTIYGVDVTPDVLMQRAAGVRRVWVLTSTGGLLDRRWPGDAAKSEVLQHNYSFVRSYSAPPFTLMLFELRSGGPAPA